MLFSLEKGCPNKISGSRCALENRPFYLKKNFIFMLFLLVGFWVILASRITVESLAIGIVASIAVLYYTRDLLFTAEEGGPLTLRYLWNFLILIVVLLVEIVKSNIAVAKIVLDPKLPIQPTFVRVPVRLKKDFHKVLYGNVVTLTPGTLTVDIVGDEYIIHALTTEAAEGMEGSILEARVMRLEVEE